jgi:hypothetical protein
MKQIKEDLNIAKQEVPGKAASQAKKMKLTHVGFGRYMDNKTQQVTHIAMNDTLVPFNTAARTNTFKTNNMNDFGNFSDAISPVAETLHQILVQAYSSQNYDDSQLDAIYNFTNGGYVDINNRLSVLPSNVPSDKIERTSPDDSLPEFIDSLDSALKKSRAPVDFITYTVLGPDYDISQFVPGTTFQFKTYRDTSINIGTIISSVADRQISFAGRNMIAVLQLNIKKNSKGMYISDYSSTPNEYEFILPRGSVIQVLSGPNNLVGSDDLTGDMNLEVIYFDCIVKT